MTQDKNELVFCPLGGAGEIGMNMNLYGYGSQDEKKWINWWFGTYFFKFTSIQIDNQYKHHSTGCC